MKVDNKLISDLAKLAKLQFDEKSSLNMQEDLKKMIGFVDELSEIDTENTEGIKLQQKFTYEKTVDKIIEVIQSDTEGVTLNEST